MRLSVVILVVGAVAALVACGRKEEAKAPAAPGEVAAPAEKPAATPLMAKRAPGLWRQSVSMAGVDFAQTTRICLDEAVDEKLAWWGGQQTRDMCAKNLITHLPEGGWRFSSVCDMGSGGVVTTTGVAQGNFNTHYQVKAESTTAGAALEQMNKTRAMTIVADRLGACPEGMKGGDVELPGGIKVNILDARPPKPPATH